MILWSAGLVDAAPASPREAPGAPTAGRAKSLPPLPRKFCLTPEFRLLLACCSTPGPSSESIALLSAAGIDWNKFVQLAARQQVALLAHAALHQRARDFIPQKAREKLKDQAVRARGRALHHVAESVRLNRAFLQEGIGAIPMKGTTLSQQLFNDPAMRQVQDIDFMVRQEDLDRADHLLTTHGYRRIFPAAELTPKMRQRTLLQDHHWTYTHSGLPLALELHWRLDLWTREDVLELWNHSQKMECMGTTFRVLDQDATLLLLCSHGAGHRWSRLKWLNDVALLLARERTAASDSLFAMAARLGLERALAQAALLAHWLLGTDLAEPLRQLVQREPLCVTLASQAVRALFMDRRRLRRMERFGLLTSLPYTLCLRKDLALTVYMRKLWMSSAYFGDFPLSDQWFWLYYPLRPLLWARNTVQRMRSGNSSQISNP